MSGAPAPGDGIFYMKVGTHAHETIDTIVERKRAEIRDGGYAFWGYGGNTCHPTVIVQPFCRGILAAGGRLHLLLEIVESDYFGEPLDALEFSIDGTEWRPTPEQIRVRGSRHALVVTELEAARLQFDMQRTRVAIGPSEGRPGSAYVQGRVDKACLAATSEPAGPANSRAISWRATIVDPYAVLLRTYADPERETRNGISGSS